MSELPKWPDVCDYAYGTINDAPDWHHEGSRPQYERARADAAMARLRVAVEALMRIRDHTIDEDDIAAIALQQIGELPE